MAEGPHDTSDDSVMTEQPIARDIQEAVGAVGNNPAWMIALVALGELAEGEYASLARQNQRIRPYACKICNIRL